MAENLIIGNSRLPLILKNILNLARRFSVSLVRDIPCYNPKYHHDRGRLKFLNLTDITHSRICLVRIRHTRGKFYQLAEYASTVRTLAPTTVKIFLSRL